MAQQYWGPVRITLAIATGIIALLVAIVVSLRPTVAVAGIAAIVTVALLYAIGTVWRRLSKRDRLGAVTTLIFILASVLIVINMKSGRMPSARPMVTVPYTATARLSSSGWQVHEEISVDDGAVKRLQDAVRLSAQKAAELRERLPLGTEWQLDRLVDGMPVYVRDQLVSVHMGLVGLTRATLDLPNLSVGHIVRLLPRSGSSVVLFAPRAAVAATTPPADGNAVTADGDVRTSVSVDDGTDTVTVALLGRWLRNPLGEKLYDLSSWPLLPYAAGGVTLALIGWLRKKILALLVAVRKRFWKSTAGDDRSAKPRPVSIVLRVPSSRRRPRTIAGARRRRS